MSGQPEAITPDELRAAIDRLGWYVQREPGIPASTHPAHPADRIIRDVERHREPGYEPYEIYEASDGRRWEFFADEDGQRGWLATGVAARYGFDFPPRPLRKMVPEGSPLADSERDLIRADLGRLLDLVGLGDFARPASSHEVFVMCLDEVAKRLSEVTKLIGDRKEACPGGC